MSYLANIDFHEKPLYFAYRRKTAAHDIFKGVFHAHQGIELLFVHQGCGNITVDRKSYEVRPGMLCIFQPYQLHHVQLDSSTDVPFIRSIVHFEPAMFESYFEKWPSLQTFFKQIHSNRLVSPCLYGVSETCDLIGLIQHMDNRLSRISKEEQYEEISLFLVAFYRFLRSHWEEHETDALQASSRKNHQVENILKWIEQHFTEPLRLEHIAEELHLSPHYLSHLFKECTGGSISDYIAARRVQHAAFLLITSNRSVSQIGEEIGITNCSYFCRFFKHHMGITPHQFRRKLEQNRHCNRAMI
ncbi:AraC family transcriptional regulator [Paenibacillus allorhizosphaerae]|uniref:HTH-type transcriptional activator RhaR n=1 Tax=Paenibacillus allorhizosphaerae TaxID=2849866 RepID=A0ABM8VI07_9BACL|nr:AraC family transcriptional regulator [Paenibacillus allorhizosphaerae]CAG7643417.1 HTH-type transcriptional activator RhaR [Paenibacillus allorhizosphaerae]